jgi:hypothetical protein
VELPEGSGWGQKMRLLAEEHAVLGHMRRQPAQHTTAMMQASVSLSLSLSGLMTGLRRAVGLLAPSHSTTHTLMRLNKETESRTGVFSSIPTLEEGTGACRHEACA